MLSSDYTPVYIPNGRALPFRTGVFHQEQHGVRRVQLRRGAAGAAHQEDGGGPLVPRQHGHSGLGVLRAERHRQDRGRLRPGPHGGSLRHGGDGGGAQGPIARAPVRSQGGEPEAVHGRRREGADGREARRRPVVVQEAGETEAGVPVPQQLVLTVGFLIQPSCSL